MAEGADGNDSLDCGPHLRCGDDDRDAPERSAANDDLASAEVRRWLRETEPDRRVRNDALLRMFFLWLLEPDEAREHLERERAYWQGLMDELQAIYAQPPGRTRKERAFRLSLEGGVRMVEARLQWLDRAVDEKI